MPASEPIPSADLLARFQAGEAAAAEQLFDRYAERLTRLARSKLAARLAARVDPEDIVLSAYRSFFVAARGGRFQVENGGDLWRLLVEVTLHKLYRQTTRHRAQRRSVHREQPVGDQSVWPEVAACEPTPEHAAIAAEELEAVLAALPPRGRQSLELRLQGYEQREIAVRLGCTERTVRRWLDEARRVLADRAGLPTPPTRRRKSSQPALPPRLPPTNLEGALAWSDFVLQEQIGAGATGKVYRAFQRSSQQQVAIKFLKKALVRERTVVERFLREARIVAGLKHPGIVPMHGLGCTPGGGYFLVLEAGVICTRFATPARSIRSRPRHGLPPRRGPCILRTSRASCIAT